MNVRLNPEDLDIVRRRVEAGEYSDEAEMVSQALALLERTRQDKIEALRQAIAVGRKDLAEGRYTDINTDEELDAFFAAL